MSFKVEQKIGKYIYVYEATNYWDKTKNQSRQKRKLLGRKDPITGKLIKTKRKGNKKIVKIQDYGHIYFLNELWKQTKLFKSVKSIYSDQAESIKSLVNYVISESKSYYLASSWSEYNYTESTRSQLSSQRISELLEKIGDRDNKQDDFFQLWIKTQKEIGGLYFDITSISTYSKMLELSEWGYNRDKEKLRQINLGIAFGIKNALPLYYKIYPGSISDVNTLRNLVEYNKEFALKQMSYILDRGFFSKSNLESLNGEKVLIPLVFHSKEAQEILKENGDKLLERQRLFSYEENLYYYVKGHKEIAKKQYDYYIFRDKELYNEQETLFFKILIDIEKKIQTAKYKNESDVYEHIENLTKGYSKYFKIKETNGVYYVEQKLSEIEKRIKRFGTFILITNITDMTEQEILKLYRTRDRIEKVFDNMKNDLDRNRLRVNTENRVRGSLFITFLSLIILSHLENKLRQSNLKMTKQEILYELKKIKITQFNDNFHLISEVSKKCKDIYKEFDIDIPMT